MCNLDCANCTYDDCINDGELNNAIYCRSWYDRNKEKKKAYQREYARRKRQNKQSKTTTPTSVRVNNIKASTGEFTPVTCHRCKRQRPIKARGLCASCYLYEYKFGNIKKYDRKYEGINNVNATVQQVPQQKSQNGGRASV